MHLSLDSIYIDCTLYTYTLLRKFPDPLSKLSCCGSLEGLWRVGVFRSGPGGFRVLGLVGVPAQVWS